MRSLFLCSFLSAYIRMDMTRRFSAMGHGLVRLLKHGRDVGTFCQEPIGGRNLPDFYAGHALALPHELVFCSYFTPVCPYPPAPLWVSSSCSTATNSACSCREITICAMRSPSLMTKASDERLTSSTPSSPR